MAHPEGIVFGNGHHLPDASALAGFADYETFADHWVEGDTTAVSHVPGHPGSVVRMQSVWRETEEEYWAVAQRGIAHFRQMEKGGIVVPAQRFVVAPSLDTDNASALYAFTDYLEGRTLTDEPADAHLAIPVIEGMAQYMRWAYHEPTEDEFLWDKGYSRQFTVQPDRVVLHDIGLDFQHIRDYELAGTGIYFSTGRLATWAKTAQIEPTETLQGLIRDIATPLTRYIRKPTWKEAMQ
jgi:hypothetical protein